MGSQKLWMLSFETSTKPANTPTDSSICELFSLGATGLLKTLVLTSKASFIRKTTANGMRPQGVAMDRHLKAARRNACKRPGYTEIWPSKFCAVVLQKTWLELKSYLDQ